MAKKLITVWLALTMLLFSSFSSVVSAASSSVQGEYLLKKVSINGQNILNYKLSDPIVAYNGYIYVPLDQKMGDLLGIEAALDSAGSTVYITPKDREWVDFCQGDVENDLDNLTMTTRTDLSVSIVTTDYPNGSRLDLSSCPVLEWNSVYYVPLNALIDSGMLGWTMVWNNFTGAAISTDSSVNASAYYDDGLANYKAGLVSYILKKNPYISQYQAEKIASYCEIYGEIYGGLDVELLLSICQTESTYYENVKNSNNYCGLMQVKDTIGAAYGYSMSQLLQAKYNIHMGCILLQHGMQTFNGNLSLALSGYAYGENAVLKGKSTLKYYNNWMKIYYNMIAYASVYQG